MHYGSGFSRRSALQLALAGVLGRLSPAFAAGTINFADIGVGDPGGDWSNYTKASGYNVNLVSIGNAPSAILNVLVAGGGTAPTTSSTSSAACRSRWSTTTSSTKSTRPSSRTGPRTSTSTSSSARASPGFNFIGYNDKIYGVPTVLQGDSFAYLPEKTGPLDSYAALFDPKWKGYVALEDNYTTAGEKTALYLKASGMANISNPDDMTPGEFKTVIDFLIEQKKAGPVPRHLEQLRAGGRPHHQQGGLCHRLLGADGVRRQVARASTPSMPIPRKATCSGRWPPTSSRTRTARAEQTTAAYHASRLHAGRLVRRQDHRPCAAT